MSSDPIQQIADLDRKYQLKFQEQAQTIAQLKTTCESKTTLKTSEDENYTQNECSADLSAENRLIRADTSAGTRGASEVLSRAVRWTVSGKTTLETSEDENYTRKE
jgi:hypothetical protein